jgi:hypothetical protein
MRATVGVAEPVRDGVRRESALDRLRRTGVAQLVKLQALAVRPAPPNNAERVAAGERGTGVIAPSARARTRRPFTRQPPREEQSALAVAEHG